MDSRWYDLDELMHEFHVIGYRTLNVGIMKINPADIIGLSQPPDQVATDHKMNVLRKSVSVHGWNDLSPADFHLLRLPYGKYTVFTGGNCRAMLASDLELPTVTAAVTVLIPNNLIKPNMVQKLTAVEEEAIPRAERQLKLISGKLKNAAASPGEKRRLNEEMNVCTKLIESMKYQMNQLLTAEAYRLRLMPKEPRPLKVNIRPSKSS
ncbi:hypothetical protein ACFQI7_35265 [Paenibacillus allorhizosphaerae]|uniref:Uncharacterized protein n=1 Tax=Paenibacillus allorhizosphaerae TaxID=2849866 RepID=A0ABM8VT60_9BACL|nr:hypothetical protein [Paenibacillus allorhizosphaerae]CAG7657461.1 hypothetical protein PAECIP111802_06733 [Paenibacillus allorhizosphaerae]